MCLNRRLTPTTRRRHRNGRRQRLQAQILEHNAAEETQGRQGGQDREEEASEAEERDRVQETSEEACEDE